MLASTAKLSFALLKIVFSWSFTVDNFFKYLLIRATAKYQADTNPQEKKSNQDSETQFLKEIF